LDAVTELVIYPNVLGYAPFKYFDVDWSVEIGGVRPGIVDKNVENVQGNEDI